MAEPSDYQPPRLWGILVVLVVTASDRFICYRIAPGRYTEFWEMMLPTFGAAVMIQAVSVLGFLASAIWTGKLSTIAFAWWQLVCVVQCTIYMSFYGPSMAGLFVGAVYSSCLVCNIWTALHYRVEAERVKGAATTHLAKALSKLKIDDCNDALEQVKRHLHDASSPTSVRTTLWRGRLALFSMLYNFFAGTLGFFFAYRSQSLKTAFSTFGLGFLGIVIVALVLLDCTRTSEALRLADHFRSVNSVSVAFHLFYSIGSWLQNGVYDFGAMCFVHWAACLYSGIVEVLVRSSLRKYSGEEEHYSEDFDE
jgi:hypothetical protein